MKGFFRVNKYTIELTGELLLFGTLSKLLQAPPERGWIQNLLAEKVFAEAPFAAEHPDVARGLSLIQAWNRSVWDKDTGPAFEALKADYLRLFIGVGKVLAPPWESVYFGDDRLLFQEQTIQVREWYRKYGLQIEKLHHEPDDQIGLELSFLANLAQLAVQAAERRDEAELTRLLHDQQAFLTEHPLRWAQAWCDLVDRHARTDFYRGIALLVNGGLKTAGEMLVRMLAEAEDRRSR
jgi:TorA maturation chaperone TorD